MAPFYSGANSTVALDGLNVGLVDVDRRPPIGLRTLGIVDHLRAGGTVPPIHVKVEGPRFKILDGRHRLLAHRMLERREILARYGVQTIAEEE